MLENGLVQSQGLTPENTVNSVIITDINRLGEKSTFTKQAPSTYTLNNKVSAKESTRVEAQVEAARQVAINSNVSSKQKGDIAEARIAELVVLYGDSGLSCYKPISDDEGIDIIVKQRGTLKTLYIQVKSRWNSGEDIMIADAKKSSLTDSYAMGVVVCRFDTSKGDLGDFLWYIPAPESIKLAEVTGDIYIDSELEKAMVNGMSLRSIAAILPID